MASQSYLEKDFEEHITEHLCDSGYKQLKSTDYDKKSCLIPEEVLKFIQETQPKEYKKLSKQYQADTSNKLLQRLSAEIESKGALHVLRKGIKDRGSNFKLAFFKPASGMNPDHKELYNKNKFTVIRQLHYSLRNENSIDLVLFLNGIPIITSELKNSLTGQFVEQAKKQYKNDRDPNEPLLKFKRCLVHFAVGNEKVYMTTRLQKDKTHFLPFNKDTENPVNPEGHKTSYLWEQIWQKDILLDLINNYLLLQKNKEKIYTKDKGLKEIEYETFIFPRYHQLDCVKTLLKYVKQDGAGKSYLVQHSAGSGKSNSIAWLSHHLASFYQNPADKERLFDSIIVVTDRRLLDKQLQDTIKQFEQTSGVVNPIDKNSAQLKKMLEQSKHIIITTLQKFPVISQSISELKGNKFAVIVDEAHSSQTGESAKHLKKALTTALGNAEKEDKDDFDIEDEIIKEIRTRGKQPNISYFAFTATPKNKTLELFGYKDENEKYIAHHIYSMRQAIEEGFILDVLENYTTFKRYFKLIKKIGDDEKYGKRKAIKLLTRYVDLQPHAIEMKSKIMLDHFMEKTVKAIQGRGRAMIVSRSRLHAIKYYLVFKKLMKEMNLKFKPIVAFSGTVKDLDTGEEYTENSLNRLQSRIDIRDAFKTPEYRILIVANKFQTGFDEPLLHTMYVDKKLSGVNAVQTLSRLNRMKSGKTESIILDFVNEIEDIETAFQPYYQTTFLDEETDPNELYDLQAQLEEFNVYEQKDIDEFAELFFDPRKKLEKLQPILDRVVERWQRLSTTPKNEQEDFRALLQVFTRFYSFISQLITFEDVELEKLYVFYKNLYRKLPRTMQSLPYEIINQVDLDSYRIQKIYEGSAVLNQQDGKVMKAYSGKPVVIEEEKDLLSNIIKLLNETYGINLSEEDKVELGIIKQKLEQSEELQAVMNKNNTLENIKIKFDKIIDDLLLDFVDKKLELYKKLTDTKVNNLFKQKWFNGYKKQFDMSVS